MDLFESGEELGFREKDPCRRVEEVFYKGGVEEECLSKLCTKLSWAGFVDISYEVSNTPDRAAGCLPVFTVTAIRHLCACHTLPPQSSADHEGGERSKKRRKDKDND